MYSFAQRADTRVFDEPLYGHYLAATPARDYHPGAAEVIQSMDTDGARVVRDCLLGPVDRPVVFFKNMAHHLVNLDWGFLDGLSNVILTRDPREVLLSYTHQVRQPTLQDLGYATQVRLVEHLGTRGQSTPILDARLLQGNPRGVLWQLCLRLGIAFDPNMLTWSPGPRPEDGVWARHWYDQVHRSTGFRPYHPKTEPVPAHLEPLLERCLPFYEQLLVDALTGE